MEATLLEGSNSLNYNIKEFVAEKPDVLGDTEGNELYLVLQGKNEDWFEILNGHFKQKAKLIYLDPPYNTKRSRGARKGYSDTNSKWNKMLYNVINKAHEYLADDGFLAISINQMELFNLKNVADQIFTDELFVGLFPIKIRHTERQLMINATFHDVYEYLLIYRKNKLTRFKSKFKPPKLEKFTYKIKILDDNPTKKELGGKKVEIYDEHQYEIIKDKPSKKNFRRYLIAGKIATANWSGEVYEAHLKNLGKDKLVKVYGLDKKWKGYRWFITGNHKRKSGVYFQPAESAGKPFLFTNHIDYTDVVTYIYKEGGGGVDFKDSKKPEALLNLLIEMTTEKGDLVMDLFGGSGTAIASAIKKGRSCIIIENEDKFVEIILRRLQNMKEGKDIDSTKHDFDFAYFNSGDNPNLLG